MVMGNELADFRIGVHMAGIEGKFKICLIIWVKHQTVSIDQRWASWKISQH